MKKKKNFSFKTVLMIMLFMFSNLIYAEDYASKLTGGLDEMVNVFRVFGSRFELIATIFLMLFVLFKFIQFMSDSIQMSQLIKEVGIIFLVVILYWVLKNFITSTSTVAYDGSFKIKDEVVISKIVDIDKKDYMSVI